MNIILTKILDKTVQMSLDDYKGKMMININDGEIWFFDENNIYKITLKETDIDAICKEIELKRKGIKLVNNPRTKEEKELKKAYDRIRWRERHTKNLISKIKTGEVAFNVNVN